MVPGAGPMTPFLQVALHPHLHRREMNTIAPADLAGRIEAEHQAAVSAAQASLEHAARCGALLIQAQANCTTTWSEWVAANLSFGIRQAEKYARFARAVRVKPELVNSHCTLNDALDAIADRRDDNHHTMRVMGSSASAEWYTPAHIFERVVEAMGGIDLDPCWHPASPVRACRTYTLADDGLAHPWADRVFLNPPYGREIDGWIAKLVAEYDSAAISEAIALLPARVDTEWFERLDPFPRCFVRGRLTFANAANPAPFPSAVVYLGRNVARFCQIFSEFGSIFVRWQVVQLLSRP
jgi:hypothetical protein